jgi:hypothetical protein
LLTHQLQFLWQFAQIHWLFSQQIWPPTKYASSNMLSLSIVAPHCRNAVSASSIACPHCQNAALPLHRNVQLLSDPSPRHLN